MKIRKGNLLDLAEAGELPIIMHGCNCFHAMGSGIAGAIAKRYPIVPSVDKNTTDRGDPSKLGDYSLAQVDTKQVSTWVDKGAALGYKEVPLDNPFKVINLYTQFTPGPDFIPSIFPTAIQGINSDFRGKTIGIPLIGCGIGGGEWHKVMNDLLIHGPDVNWEVCVL